MKNKPIFDLEAFLEDRTALEIVALVHLLPEQEKAEILEIVRRKAIKSQETQAAQCLL